MPTSYATETDELLGLPEGWLTRSGTTVIFGILLLSLVTAYFIPYPKIVTVPVTVYGQESTVDLFTTQAGRLIHIGISEGEEVEQNDLLFVLESTTDWKTALTLEAWLDNDEIERKLPSFSGLGALQPSWVAFRSSAKEYQNFLADSSYLQTLRSIAVEQTLQDSLWQLAEKKQKLEKADYVFLVRKATSDSTLFLEGAISLEDWESSQRAALAKQRSLLQGEEVQLSLCLRIEQLERQKTELQARYLEEKRQFLMQMDRTKTNLRDRLNQWARQYLVRSPQEGRISFLAPLSRFETIAPNIPLVTLITSNNSSYAYAEVGERYIADLEVGNTARIKLAAYPELEFGWLDAEVQTVSQSVGAEGKYSTRLNLTKGFRTSENKILEMKPQMQGEVEILLEERSFLTSLLLDTLPTEMD